MAKSMDIVDFNPSDGFTPLQVQKLNWNFRKLAVTSSQVDVDQTDAIKGLVIKTTDLAADQKMTVGKSGTRNKTVLNFGIPAAQVRITDAQVDSVLANDAPTGDSILNLTGLSRFWAGVKQYVDNAIGAIGSFVLKAGDTMTGSLRMKTSSIDRDGANPSADQASNEYTFYDKDDEQIGKVVCYRRTDGRIDIHMNAINEKSDGTSVTNTFQVRTAKDGTCTYYVSSPANFRSAISAVNKAGDTMTGDLVIDGSSANKSLYVDATNIDVDTNPSENTYVQGLHVRDKDNDEISHFEIGQDSSGGLWHNFASVRQKVNGTFGWYQCYMKVAKNGTVTYSLHTPAAFRNALGASSGIWPLAIGGTATDNTNRAINTVFAGPSSGSAGNASWRSLVAADIPNLNASKINAGTFGADRIPTLSTSKISGLGTFKSANKTGLSVAANVDTITTGPSLSLEAGSWYVMAMGTFQSNTGAGARLCQTAIGNTATGGFYNGRQRVYNAGGNYSMVIANAFVVVSATTTIYGQISCSTSVSNNSCWIGAIRIK